MHALHSLRVVVLRGALHTLQLRDNNFGDEGARLVAAHPALRDVQVLALQGSALSAYGAQALAASQTLPEHVRVDWARRVRSGEF